MATTSRTNEAAERLNAPCQHTRIRNGELDTSGLSTTIGAHRIFAGDEIATRHNDRSLVTDRGVTVKNRAVWTIDQIHPDGSLIATGKSGTVMLPREYVAEHVDLAYARTAMGGQGRTVKGGLLFADRATDLRNLYVPMTRGTETNEAFLATVGEETALDIFVRSMTTDWIDQPAHTRRDELNDTKPHRPGLLDNSQLRHLVERARSGCGRFVHRIRELLYCGRCHRTNEHSDRACDSRLRDSPSADARRSTFGHLLDRRRGYAHRHGTEGLDCSGA